VAKLNPTFGWLNITDYRGWTPGDPDFARTNNFVEPGVVGERLSLSGLVLTRNVAPMANVVIEFWQADAAGNYHMAEFKMRDRQKTVADGRFSLETIVPGYTGAFRRINFIANAVIPSRVQPLFLSAAIYLATEEELSRSISDAERSHVLPGARIYRDDPAFLSLETLPIKDGVKQISYNIVFDLA